MPKIKHVKKRVCHLDTVFGRIDYFEFEKLPSQEDVLKKFISIRNKMQSDENGKSQSIKKIAALVAEEIEKVWHETSIPIVTNTRMIKC